jgi:hypothetical protein
VKTKFLSYLFCSHKYHKIENYFIFELVQKEIWASLQKIIEPFTQKIVIKLSQKIRDPEKTLTLVLTRRTPSGRPATESSLENGCKNSACLRG